MIKHRLILAFVLLLSSAAYAQPATTEPTAPKITSLRANPVGSGEIDLIWYDNLGTAKKYILRRSDDGGATFHTIHSEVFDEKNNTGYSFKDTGTDKFPIKQRTEYVYRLETPTKEVLSADVSAKTPAKTLLEVAQGTARLQLSDLTDFYFWQSTILAGVLWMLGFVPQLLVAGIIFLMFYIGHRISGRLASRSLKRAGVDAGIHDMLIGLLKWSILGFAIIIAGDQLGIHIAALLAGISIAGLAIGFAAQDTLANLIASVVIFWDKPFKVGDWVTLNSHYGRVMRITFRTTRILMQNGDVLSSPNTTVLGSNMLNHSTHTQNWVNVPITLPDKIAIPTARAALLACVAGDKRIDDDPAPRVVVDSVGDDSVSLFLSFCINDESQQSELLQEYLEKAKAVRDELKK